MVPGMYSTWKVKAMPSMAVLPVVVCERKRVWERAGVGVDHGSLRRVGKLTVYDAMDLLTRKNSEADWGAKDASATLKQQVRTPRDTHLTTMGMGADP